MQEPPPEHPAAPVRPSERIDAIDMLPGIALFIVLAVNAATEFRVSIFEQFLPNASAPSLDSFWGAVILALHSKGPILFSFLFGVGLAIQFDRLAGNERRLVLLRRRLAVLTARRPWRALAFSTVMTGFWLANLRPLRAQACKPARQLQCRFAPLG